MGIKTVAEINKYQSVSINPMEHPNQIYELYSVPSFDNQYPEIIKGSEIGSSKITVEEGDVLVCKINPRINRVWVVEHHTKYPLLASSEWIVVRNGEIESNYLKWYFSSPPFRNMLTSQVAGIGGSLTRAQPKQVAKYPVPIPARSVQQDIVCYLDKISDLISLRKQQLQKLDELVKSRFIELFGNLVIGDKVDTNKKKIGEIASVTKLAGFEFTKYIQYKEQGDIIMLRGLNCKKGHLVLDDIKWIDKETSDLLPRSKLYYGDILMTYAGTIGDVAMVDADDKYHLAPNVAKITLNNKKACNPVFLMHLFMYTNDYIMTFASVVAQASINMEKIRNFEYYFPPVEQQNQFAAFVEQTDKSKLAVQQSLDKLKLLKEALMQKYFG